MLPERLPVTFVTGESIESTVTTTKRVLDALGDRRVVLVGRDVEHGRWGERVVVEPRVVYRSAGCACCALRADLIEVLPLLATGRHRPEWAIVVEPPGTDHLIAIQSLLGDPTLRRTVVLDGVVATIDATMLSAQLASASELRSVGFGLAEEVVPAWTSTIVLDGLSRLTLSGRTSVLRALHEGAPLAGVATEKSTLDGAIGRGLLDPRGTSEIVSQVLRRGGPVIEIRGALDSERVDAVLKQLIEGHAVRLLMFMASIALAGRPYRLVAHGARSSLALGRLVGSQDERTDDLATTSRLLVLGHGVDLAGLRRDLVAQL